MSLKYRNRNCDAGNRIVAMFLFFIFCSGRLFSQAAFSEDSFDLYLLIGQSNMAGRGALSEQDAATANENVLVLTQGQTWVPAQNPLHFDKPAVAGVGPGLSFGIAMAEANPGKKIGLIPCAVGGTSIDLWKPGAYDKVTNTHPFDDMMDRLKEAQCSGVLKGILWHQGESDSKPEKATTYLAKLENLVALIRMEAGDAQLPFVAGQLGRYNAQYKIINRELEKLPAHIPYTAVASSRKLTDKGDHTHFDSPSQVILGKRMAKKMKRLQAKKKRPISRRAKQPAVAKISRLRSATFSFAAVITLLTTNPEKKIRLNYTYNDLKPLLLWI